MGPYYSFSHILLLSHQIFDQSWLFVIVTLMDTLLLVQKKKKKSNQLRLFHADSA